MQLKTKTVERNSESKSWFFEKRDSDLIDNGCSLGIGVFISSPDVYSGKWRLRTSAEEARYVFLGLNLCWHLWPSPFLLRKICSYFIFPHSLLPSKSVLTQMSICMSDCSFAIGIALAGGEGLTSSPFYFTPNQFD